jgi:tetratricopeptide (TPR) repeat protein
MRSCVCHLVLAACLLLAPAPRNADAAASGAAAFEQGFKAFRAGDYAAALGAFLEARRAGLDTSTLRYNLGATYFRLGRYADAEREFRALARDPAWAALAEYNLGLTALRMERRAEAAEHFRQAYRLSTEPALRTLAATALERMRVALPLARTTVIASFGGGYDSNVTLSPDLPAAGLSDESDVFAEALVAASHLLTGPAGQGLYAQGGAILRKYADVTAYDQAGVQLGIVREFGADAWQASAGASVEHLWVGGDTLQRTALLDLNARRLVGDGRDLRGRYRPAYVRGGGDYRYLDGWQHRASADFGFPLAGALARVGYQLEVDDRADYAQGNEFFSYSAIRHSLLASAAWPAVGAWRAEARGELRFSRYDDPYRFADGSVIEREDDRYGIALRASRPLEGRWRFFVGYDYYRNRSTIDAYDYSRHQLMAGVEAALER